MSGMQETQKTTRRTISLNGGNFVGNIPDDVWEKVSPKIQEIYGQFMKEAPSKTLYAMGKKLEQTGRYTGYFWSTRDANGQTRVRGFFGVYGILEGSQSKHSYIVANFKYDVDAGTVNTRWRTQYFTPPGWFPRKKKNEENGSNEAQQEQDAE
ncbi:MAG: hypothetical protein RXR16_03650 [Thermocladium sp.]